MYVRMYPVRQYLDITWTYKSLEVHSYYRKKQFGFIFYNRVGRENLV